MPKVNIISLGTYEGAGIRVDDFVLLSIFLLIVLAAIKGREFIITPFELAFIFFILAVFNSYALNITHERGSIFYVVRFVEYAMFLYAGMMASSSRKVVGLLIAWLLLNSLISLLQTMGLLGGTFNGVIVSDLARATGLTNNATETAMVSLLIFVYFAATISAPKALKSLFYVSLMFSLASFSIFLSGSRMPIAFLLLFYGIHLFKHSQIARLAIITGSAILTPVVLALVLTLINPSKEKIETNDVQQDFSSRITTLFAPGSLDIMMTMLNKVTYEKQSFTNKDVQVARKDNYTLLADGADRSLLMRVTKWTYAAKTYYHQGPFYWVVGVGPGVWYNALDGGLLRILTENGIFGLIAFLSLYLFRPRYKSYDPARPLILVFYMGNFFIDHYLFYKVMSCLLLILGAIAYEVWRLKNEDNDRTVEILPESISAK